jgi:phospholipase C
MNRLKRISSLHQSAVSWGITRSTINGINNDTICDSNEFQCTSTWEARVNIFIISKHANINFYQYILYPVLSWQIPVYIKQNRYNTTLSSPYRILNDLITLSCQHLAIDLRNWKNVAIVISLRSFFVLIDIYHNSLRECFFVNHIFLIRISPVGICHVPSSF